MLDEMGDAAAHVPPLSAQAAFDAGFDRDERLAVVFFPDELEAVGEEEMAHARTTVRGRGGSLRHAQQTGHGDKDEHKPRGRKWLTPFHDGTGGAGRARGRIRQRGRGG